MAKNSQKAAAQNEAPAWDGVEAFRKLWSGGERRRAVDKAKEAELSEEDWAALHAEFPELLDVINA